LEKKQIAIEEGLFTIPDSPEKKPYLIGSKCNICSLVTFPKLTVCPNCAKKDVMEEIQLDGEGTIDTYSVTYAALPGFKIPSIQAYINLNAGPRVWGLIDCEEQDLEIGMKVELVIKKFKEDTNGNEIMSYLFRPCKPSGKMSRS